MIVTGRQQDLAFVEVSAATEEDAKPKYFFIDAAVQEPVSVFFCLFFSISALSKFSVTNPNACESS